MRMTIFVVLLLVLVSAVGQTADPAAITVTASTAWAGSIAAAAGVDQVDILAPLDLRHPPEYDFSPGDIQRAISADWLVWGGYEPFFGKLVEAGNIPKEKIVRVNTNNTPPILRETVKELAARLGTDDRFSEWEMKLNDLVERLRAAAAQQRVSDKRVVVQAHLRAFVEWLGYDVIAVYGPAELTPGLFTEILAEQPDMVIDNWHNSQGEVFRGEVPEFCSLINFPGAFGTETVLEVIEYNARVLGLLE